MKLRKLFAVGLIYHLTAIFTIYLTERSGTGSFAKTIHPVKHKMCLCRMTEIFLAVLSAIATQKTKGSLLVCLFITFTICSSRHMMPITTMSYVDKMQMFATPLEKNSIPK